MTSLVPHKETVQCSLYYAGEHALTDNKVNTNHTWSYATQTLSGANVQVSADQCTVIVIKRSAVCHCALSPLPCSSDVRRSINNANQVWPFGYSFESRLNALPICQGPLQINKVIGP